MTLLLNVLVVARALLKRGGTFVPTAHSPLASGGGTLLALTLATMPQPAHSAEPALLPAQPDQYARVIRGSPDVVTVYNNLTAHYLFFSQGALTWNTTVDMPGDGITVTLDPASGSMADGTWVPLRITVSAAASAAKGTTVGKVTFTTSGIHDPLNQYLNSADLALRVEVAVDNSVHMYAGASGAFLECEAGKTASQDILLVNDGPDRLYQWKVSTVSPWLSVKPDSGDFINSEGAYTERQKILTLTAAAGSLAPGDYSGKLIVTAANLKTAAYEYPVRFRVKPASSWAIFSLDQKLLARGASLRLNVRGANLQVPVSLDFLKEDGSVDPGITFSSIAVNGTDQIEAGCAIAADAALGSRTLHVKSNNNETRLANAVQVVDFRLEVNQGAKTEPAALRVANHPTVVRAFVDSAGPVGDLVGRLYAFNENGEQIPGSPFSPNAPSPRDGSEGSPLLEDVLHVNPPYTQEERFYMRDSLNFYFKNTLHPGRLYFWLAVSATDPAAFPPGLGSLTLSQLGARRDFLVCQSLPVQDFRLTRSYRVLALIDNRLSPMAVRRIEARVEMANVYLEAAFPGEITLYTRSEVSKAVLDLDALKPAAWNPVGSWWANVHARLARYLATWNETSLGVRYDQIALATDGTGAQAICGSGTLGMADKYTSFIAGDYPTTFAHELAHNLGLGDTYCGFECGNLLNPLTPCYLLPVNCRRSDALPGGNRVEDGAVRLFPVFDSRGQPVVGATACVAWPGGPFPPSPGFNLAYQRIDLMGTANDENSRWPDLAEWNHLFNVLQVQASAPAPLAAAGGDYLSSRGVIGVDDSVNMIQFAKEAQSSFGGSLPDGDYRIELVNAGGTALSSQPFGLDFRASGAGLATAVSFAASTRWENGAVLARIRHGTKVLISQPVSARAPVVVVTDPAGGPLTSSPIDIRWIGSDADADSLTYTVFYLQDDGSPVPLASDLTTTSYSWTPGGAGGCSQGRIVVVASDGLNQGRGESAPFSLAKQTPTVVFLSPEPDMAVPAGTLVTLSGAGTDPEDGFLPPESLMFISSIDGSLGQGPIVSPVLSVGAHTLTLLGVDRDGNSAEAGIQFTVGPANQVPVAEFVTPAQGTPGTSVMLAGRNLDPANTQIHFGAAVATVMSVNSTQCVVSVPHGLAPGVVPVSAIARGFTSAPITFNVIAGRPRILGLVPPSGAPGTPVMVRVAEVDPAANPTIQFGDVTAAILGISGDGLLVAVPVGISPGDMPVTVSSPPATSEPVMFRVLTGDPLTRTVVRMILPDFGAAGDVVRLVGSGFSPVLTENVVSFGGVPAVPVWASAQELQVPVPAGIQAGPATAWVSVREYPSNPLTFTARAPSDSNVTLSILRTAGGLEISWAATSTDYVIETADQVWPAANWTAIALPVQVRGDRKVGDVSAGHTTQFIRLRQGP